MKHILETDQTALVVIDIQERLVKAMDDDVLKKITDNTLRLVKGANVMGIRTLFTQQYSKGLGDTIMSLKEHLEGDHVEKTDFSCCGESSFNEGLKGVKTVILAGMETHVCVLQTALDLMNAGFAVHIAADAVCSRSKFNWKTGLRMMESAGAVITCTETVLFQLVKRAGTPEFKEISNIIK
ncbi:MAG: isochorismatase family protein [Deferribacterales bacterium]